MGSEPALTVYHGGGFICGSIASHNRLCPRLIRVAGCTITSVDYRLAPEHRYPAAFEDAYGALNGVAGHGQDHGIDVFRIAVAHDSAEAVLAAVASISARDEMGPALRRHLLIYSGTDLEVDTQSRRQFESGYSSKAGHPDVRRGLCAGAARAVRPWPLTGLAASRAGLPRPRASRDHPGRMRSASGGRGGLCCPPCRLWRGGGNCPASRVFHGFVSMFGLVPEADEAVTLAASRLQQALIQAANSCLPAG